MKWRVILVGSVMLPVLFFIFGCGGKSEISRSKAGNIIQGSDKFTPETYCYGDAESVYYTSLVLTEDQSRSGLAQGFWGTDAHGGAYLTPKGKTLFRSISSPSPYSLVTKPIPRRVIEVTGIADGPGTTVTTKEVQFTWEWDWDAMPKDVVGPAPKPSTGRATLKFYDDGWRLEEIKLKLNLKR